MLDLNDVAVFVQVVRYGSFAEASRRLGIPPNTLSRRVQLLEAHLGTRLMQRSTRKLSLTSAGQDFHGRCADAVEGLVDAGQSLLSRNDAPSGAGARRCASRLLRLLPDGMAGGVPGRVPAGSCGLHAQRCECGPDCRPHRCRDPRWCVLEDSSLIARRVLDAGLDGLVASPAYIAARGAPASLQELADHDCLVFAHPSGRATWSLSTHDGTDVEVEVAGRLSGNTVQVLRKAALAGLGIALLPSPMTRRGAACRPAGAGTPAVPPQGARRAPGLRQPSASAFGRFGVH